MRTVSIAAHRARMLQDLRADADVGGHVAILLIAILVCGAAYGVSIGIWHGPRLAVYSAIKVPMLMIITAVIMSLFNWVTASQFGMPARPAQTFALSLFPLAVASVIAASVAPVMSFFAMTLPPAETSQRTLHNVFYLLHLLLIAGSGVAGTAILRRLLRDVLDGDDLRARRVQFAWIAGYALVGGEVAWALRPFVGSVYLPVVFLRGDALHGNVYEFIFTDIVPHFLRRLSE
jgi:hypothetical protein